VLTANRALWALLFQTQLTGVRGWLFGFSLLVALLGMNMALLRLLSPGRLLRVMLSLLLVLAACASWVIDTYGVALDSDMLRNAFQTNAAEARDFLGWPLLWRIAWQAGLPMLVIWSVRLPMRIWQRSLREYVLGVLAGIAVVLVAGLPFYSSYASFFRNEHAARYLLVPVNALAGSLKVARLALRARQPYVKVGEDARREGAAHPKPMMVLLVVGETARAANFSLGGYARETNPQLRQKGVFYFGNVHSCGTATAVSVPCMFSDLPRDEFRLSAAENRDTVLDIAQRAGWAVNWIENQSGCKKVCARVPTERAEPYHPESCRNGECRDDALLYALDEHLRDIVRDNLIVMHSMGSHGPAYHRRVPPEGQVFKPVCATERIDTCSDEQIVNSYDNSIVYTDHVLAGLIDRLAAQQDRVDSVLLYVSDHGESLGENGLYLHGQPWMIAPDVQKRVPMLMWFSAGATTRLQLDAGCLRGHLQDPLSHDNLSHTLLGLGDVSTTAYRPTLDLLRPCRVKG
jgi:lipid A ethanolaminephosphotransferase